MGDRGPVGKRSEERRRRNKPESGEEVEKVSSDQIDDELRERLENFERPEPGEKWDDFALGIWRAAESSMFSVWYQPSDWLLLWGVIDDWNLERQPRPVQIGEDADGVPEYKLMRVPMPGAKLSAIQKILSLLLFDEGTRRRLRMELTDEKSKNDKNAAGLPEGVTAIREGLFDEETG